MINRTIYENALRLLAQSTAEGENPDFEERAPFLLASFCSEAQEVDHYLRMRTGDRPASDFEKVWLPLDEEFPLSERLAPLACLYLASLLILEEDGELSDRLYDRYCDGITAIWNGIPSVVESITQEYLEL